MLPDPLRLLVSAYSAGDLSPRRKAAAERLLRHSAEARRLLKEIKFNRRRLRALPRPTLPADFAERVVRALPEKAPIIRPTPVIVAGKSRYSATYRWTMPVAAAVALVFGTILFVSWPEQTRGPARSVANRSRPAASSEVAQLPDVGPPEDTSSPPPEVETPAPTVVASDSKPPTAANPPGPKVAPFGTATVPPPRATKVTPPRLPLPLAMPELETLEVRQKLQRELTKADAQHLDLFCRDTVKGFDRIQATLRARGVHMIVDGVVQQAVKRKVRGQFLVYCEDLTAVEWIQVFQALAAGDKKDSLFDSVVVLPFDVVDQKELMAVAGSDLTNSDGKPRTADVKKDAKSALVAGLGPVRTPANSREVRQFLDARPDRPANTIAVVLVIRTVGG
ncbi:MAG TPA: hypothetical protein VH120_07240 [Gemmataceae bacterium]|nr:hypothetical protein [Gemmataceae bacterium]